MVEADLVILSHRHWFEILTKLRHSRKIKRLNISKEVYLTIKCPAIAKVRAHHPFNKIVRISKIIYRWMPVGHNWQKCKLPSDKCPCCGCPDETFHHLLQCTNRRMTKVRRAGLSKIQNQCEQSKLPTKFTDTIISILGSFCRGEALKSHWSTEPIQQAVEAQQRIGIYHMAVGLLALRRMERCPRSKQSRSPPNRDGIDY